jgi:hypothetical protein
VAQLVYYGGLVAFVVIVTVAQGVKTAWQRRATESDVPSQAAKFDIDKDCKVVYINSPIDYSEDTVASIEAKSGKKCVIRVFTYNVRNETEVSVPPPSTIDTTRSVPGVLELPRYGTD